MSVFSIKEMCKKVSFALFGRQPSTSSAHGNEVDGTVFVPKDGKRLMIMGQDTISVDAYRNAIGIDPAGVTGYTDLSLLGLDKPIDNGGGPNHMSYLAEQYPNSVVAQALHAVDDLDDINSGLFDQKLHSLVSYLVSLDRPIFLRFAYEFDGTWNHYEPNAYKKAWKRMHRIIREERAETHIAMVWQGASYCSIDKNINAWYPGDEYVDWIGLSYFTPQDCNCQKVNDLVNFARQKQKPLMIAESANQRHDNEQLTYTSDLNGANRQALSAQQVWETWYARFFQFIEDNNDVIRAVAYINADWDSQSMWSPPYPQGYWGDTRIHMQALIKDNWITEISKDDWLNASSDLFEKLGYKNQGPPDSTTPESTDEPVAASH